MGHQNNVISFFIVSLLLFLAWYIPASGQKSSTDMKLGAVFFIGKSTKLTQNAKATLDSCIKEIQNNPAMQVQAVSFNKDFCDECGDRSWERAKIILGYLYKHGVPDNKLTVTNQLDGELNKVDLFLISPIKTDTPHPFIKKTKKAVQE